MAANLEPIAAWQVLLLTLQALQVAFLWLHDWIPLGRLNNVAAARGSNPRRLIRTTLIQSIPFSIVLAFSARYFDHAYPEWLRILLWLSYGLLLLGEIRAWWWPYLVRVDSVRAASSIMWTQVYRAGGIGAPSIARRFDIRACRSQGGGAYRIAGPIKLEQIYWKFSVDG